MEYDVIVVGSGPSGASAAYFSASYGLKVLCIDRLEGERFDRYHSICGECISDKGARVIGLRPEEIRNDIRTFRLDWPGGVRTDVKVKGYIIERTALLARLRREAEEKGCTFVHATVRDVSYNQYYTVYTADGQSYTSRYLVGADGAYSVVRKKLFGTEPLQKVPVEMRISAEPAEEGVLAFTMKGRGRFYGWVFPSGTGSSVGAVRGNLEEGEGLHGARIIPIGWTEEFVRDGAALVGDAGGFVNPVSFGGLRIAFDSGRHVAEALSKDDLSLYSRWWRRSRLSDRRFWKAKEAFAEMDESDLAEFSKQLGHGLYPSGVISVLRHPGRAWLYIGCLMSLRHGW